MKNKLETTKGGWVVDGLYSRMLEDTVSSRIDILVFLDIPLYRRIPRVIFRSIRRIYRKELLWGKNRETVTGAYKLIRFMISHSKSQRVKIEKLGSILTEEQSFVRLRSNKDAESWIKTL